MSESPTLRVLWKMLQMQQAGTYGPQAAELQARRARAADLKRRLEEADKRVLAYEAALRADTEQVPRASHEAAWAGPMAELIGGRSGSAFWHRQRHTGCVAKWSTSVPRSGS